MKITYLLFFLLLCQSTSAQPAKSVADIRALVKRINTEKHYQTKVLENDEFIDGTDRGSSLTGYYKGDQLVKIVEWVGISNCISIREFYFNQKELVFISHIGKTWTYDMKKEDFNYEDPKLDLQSRFYFSNDNLIKFIEGTSTTDCTGQDSLQDTTELVRLSKRYPILLGDCPLNTATGKLQSIDYKDSSFYQGLAAYTHDTITGSGWKIKYLVKDDCTKTDDVYIEWSKGKKKAYKRMNEVLNFRSYFIPQYAGENESYIFFEHGCATECSALLLLNKDSMNAVDYMDIVKYDIPTGQIVFIPAYVRDDDKFKVAVVNLQKHQEKIIAFNNICMGVWKPGCIKNVVFNNNKVIVTATLTIDDVLRDKTIQETQTAAFN